VIYLLDGNVLVALTAPAHVHHEDAHRWRATASTASFATCPITQGTLLRVAVRHGANVAQARAVLAGLTDNRHHEFWPDVLPYLETDLSQVRGHRQVTDAYLAALARHHDGRLATFDAGLASVHADVTELVPTA